MRLSALKNILTNGWTPSLIGLPLALSAFAASKNVWVAQPTGTKQCDEVARATLGAAISDLESKQLVVKIAAVGTLNDRLQCSACSVCPDGSYNIAVVEGGAAVEETARSQGWEVVNAVAVRIEE